MKYILIMIMMIALTVQVSCKENDGIKQTEVKKELNSIVQTKEEANEQPLQTEITNSESNVVKKDPSDVKKEEKSEIVKESVKLSEEQKKDIAQISTDIKKDEPKNELKKDIENPKISAQKLTDEKGVVSYVEGNVKKKTTDEVDFKTSVSEKTTVKSRESYKTMVKSRAELELSGLDILRLAPKTTVDLIALYEETKDGKQKTDIKLTEGDLWAQVNSSDENSEFMMDTDIAAAAITGTNFRMSRSGELTEMKVYHGEVKISNAKGKMDKMDAVSVMDFKAPKQTMGPKQISGPKQVSLDEWVYIVKNMQQISFDKSGKVVSAGEFKASDKSEQNEWVEWNKKRDRQKGLK